MATANDLKDALRVYIADNYTRDIRLDDFCRAMGNRDRRATQRVLSNSGTSWRKELVSYRMKKGRELLRTTEMSIGTIATEVGYHDHAYFSKEFRKHNDEKLSPVEYRRAARKAQR